MNNATSYLTNLYDSLYYALYRDTNKPKLIVITNGILENTSLTNEIKQFTDLFNVAINNNVCIYCPSGDNINIPPPPAQLVLFPASSSSVVACGGVQYNYSSDVSPNITTWTSSSFSQNITPWAISGGGTSIFYNRPSYQSNINSEFRSVPDISSYSNSSYNNAVGGIYVWCNNIQQTLIGTCCSVGFLAAQHALIINNLNTNIGFINPNIYIKNTFIKYISNNNSNNNLIKWNPISGLGINSYVKLLEHYTPSPPNVVKPTKNKSNNAKYASIGVIFFFCLLALFLSLYKNREESFINKLVYSIIAFFFNIFYIIYYFINKYTNKSNKYYDY